jgi:hypothetical protein
MRDSAFARYVSVNASIDSPNPCPRRDARGGDRQPSYTAGMMKRSIRSKIGS